MRFCPVLIWFLLVPYLLPQEAPRDSATSPQVPYVERQEKEFSFYPGGKIEISALTPGSLRIVGWKKAVVRMEAEKIVYYDSPENAKAAILKAPIRVRYGQTNAAILTPLNPPAKMEINLLVYVPGDKTDIKATVSLGDFSIEEVNGWVEATVKAEGGIDAKSMSGYFSAMTPRGDISVEMSGNRWRGLEFAALTQNGSANLRIPLNYSAALQLETRAGKIVVDYPPQVVEGEETPPDIIIRKNSQSLKATVGDGGAPVKLVTYAGDVTLLKKE